MYIHVYIYTCIIICPHCRRAKVLVSKVVEDAGGATSVTMGTFVSDVAYSTQVHSSLHSCYSHSICAYLYT